MDDAADADEPRPGRETALRRGLHVGRGFLMGAADAVPGVSGGTVALVLGIYARLVRAIRSLDWQLAKATAGLVRGASGWNGFVDRARRADLGFLILLGLGIATAIVSLAGPITALLSDRPVEMLALFFGLILASAWIPFRLIEPRERTAATVVGLVAAAAGGALLAYVVAGLPLFQAPAGLWFVPVAGAVAICAMILPGISGAFLLLLMGMYEPLLAAVHERDVVLVGLFLAGALAGILSFSRLLNHLLDRHRNVTLAALTGLMIGSLRKLWPFKDAYDAEFGTGANVLPATWGPEQTAALVMFLAGVAVVVALSLLAERAAATPAEEADRGA